LIVAYSAFLLAAGYVAGQSGWLTWVGLGASGGTPAEARAAFKPFWEVYQYANRFYVDQPLDQDKLAEGAINGLLATLDDPNTRYIDPQAEAEARSESEGEFQGIGAEVVNQEGTIVVVAPIEGSPAEKAGLQPGDILRSADGVELTGMAVDEAAALVRGPAGTTVRLLVERDGQTFELDIVRDIIPLISVRGEMRADGLAYVRLNRFAQQTDKELEDKLNTLLPQQPTGLILDLRNNPGGDRDVAVQVADEFVRAGVVLTQRYGDGREETFDATDEGPAQDIPMVVLINEGSASASELVAGALQDYGRAKLIGVQSFGKGTVQTWIGLSNGGGVRITIARWLTPNGTWIHGQGLTPDFATPWPEDAAAGSDPQLQAAVNYLLTGQIAP
jgi:carboxyl-terminal processing protease